MKSLLVIFKPRDIPEFEEATMKLKGYDKLWIKYTPQEQAYYQAREIFLKSDKYSHLIILPDDLIVSQRDVDIIANEAKEFASVSGWCNNTAQKTYADQSFDAVDWDTNVSRYSPPPKPFVGKYEEYKWIPIEEMLNLQRDAHIPDSTGRDRDHIAVLHQGFALTRLSKRVVADVPFRTDEGCCVDACLSLDMMRARIPQFINVHVRLKHLATKLEIVQTGKRAWESVLEIDRSQHA